MPPMTRNDAYKYARMVWRRSWRLHHKSPDMQIVAMKLAAAGYTTSDTGLVFAWLKAWRSGAKYPNWSTYRDRSLRGQNEQV